MSKIILSGFNIVGHLEIKNISLPILSVIMKDKYQIKYINLLENFKLMLIKTQYNNKIYSTTGHESS